MEAKQLAAEAVFGCVNCGEPLDGSAPVARGPDTAWHGQCLACHELVAGQMELVEDQPGGAPIQIYRCRDCGDTRACRPGWTTRCHICLDERSTGPIITQAGQEFLASLAREPVLAMQARQALRLAGDEDIPPRRAVEIRSSLTLAEELRRLDRPGWTILAADVYGLPWKGTRTWHSSHGTWARHDACGTVGKLRPGSPDCQTCGPEPGSPTHRARQNDPYLLYLVCTKRWQKFGVGDQRRIREHVRGGAEVIQVLRAPFANVMLAEASLKQLHCDAIAGRARRGMIESFGQGTEVTRRHVTVNLDQALPDSEDVTSWFA